MLSVKILGSGCADCKRLESYVHALAEKRDLQLEIEKVTDYAEIMKWQSLSTPGLVVNDRLVSAGTIPSEQQLLQWLQPAGDRAPAARAQTQVDRALHWHSDRFKYDHWLSIQFGVVGGVHSEINQRGRA